MAAAEALLSLLAANGPLGREHFAALAPVELMMPLLDCRAVPGRWGRTEVVVTQSGQLWRAGAWRAEEGKAGGWLE